MKKWNYGRCYAWFICMCCVADLGAAAGSSQGFNIAGEVPLEGGVVCLSQKPLDDSDTRERGTGSVLHVEDKRQSDEDRPDAGPYVEKYISTIFGFCSSKKEVTLVYREMLTGKKHQFCFSEKEQQWHSISVDNGVAMRCRLTTCNFVYQCVLQGVWTPGGWVSPYRAHCFESDDMEAILRNMCDYLEGVINDSCSCRCEEAMDLWSYKHFWLKSDDRKRVWKQVDNQITEFPNNRVRVTVGALTLEGMFFTGEFVPKRLPKDSMSSVMWTDFCSKEMPQTKKAVKPHE